jgi:hypothetical protein
MPAKKVELCAIPWLSGTFFGQKQAIASRKYRFTTKYLAIGETIDDR